MPDVYNDVVAATYREAEDYLRIIGSHLEYESHDRVRPASLTAAELILERDADDGVDLIVVSSHGRSGVDC
jgi:nucleotide-binding universal stress UspA family protein